uniref:Uncharacterized protein n=1 Tax=Triticum urartu TaxID=4572 RepID=A0A8R7QQB5_TRIUA
MRRSRTSASEAGPWVAYPDMIAVQATRDLSRGGIASNTCRAGCIRPARVWARSSECCAVAEGAVEASGMFSTDLYGVTLVTPLQIQEERGSKGGGSAIGGS